MTQSTVTSLFDWEDILDTLESQNCVLFLGPQAYPGDRLDYLEEEMIEALDVHNEANPFIKDYYKDGFFLLHDETYRNKVIRRIKRFYEQPFEKTPQLLLKVARLPFKIIFNLTPDLLLIDAFRQLKLPFQHDYYFKNHPPNPFTTGNTEKPILYQMLGTVKKDESLVLTHNDLFDYLKSIFNSQSMHTNFKEELKESKLFLFLGLSYDKWYMQLLMRILSLHTQDAKNLERYSSSILNAEKTKLYSDQFKIEFVPNQAARFIDQLYEKCDQRGILKVLGQYQEAPQKSITTERILDQITQGDISEAMADFQTLLRGKRPASQELLEKLTLLMSEYHFIEEKFQTNTEDAYSGKERNRILLNFIKMVSQSKSF